MSQAARTRLDRPIYLTREQDTLKLAFGYDETLVELARLLPYARFDRETRTWTVDITRQAVDLLRGWYLSDGLTDVCVDELISPSETLPDAPPATLRRGSLKRPFVVMTGTRDEQLYTRLKSIPGAQWERQLGALSYPATSAAALGEMAARGIIADPEGTLTPAALTLTFDGRTGVFKVLGDKRAQVAFDKNFPLRDVITEWHEKGFDTAFGDPFTEEVYRGEIARHGTGLQPVGLLEDLFQYQAESVAVAVERTGFGIYDQPGLGKCLIGSTLVWTVHGPVPIEELWEWHASPVRVHDGDGEWAEAVIPVELYTADGGELTTGTAKRVYRQLIDAPVRTVTLANGAAVTATLPHRFLVEGKGWHADVTEGDRIAIPTRLPDANGREPLEWSTAVTVTTSQHAGYVYDLEVETTHNYIAGGMACHNTAQAIAWALELMCNRAEADRTVVVVPGAVKTQFGREITRFTGHQDVIVIDGDRKRRERLYAEAQDARWVVLNYDLLHIDYKRISPLVSGQLLIADEAHRVKNRQSKRTQAMKQLGGKAARRLALTGTPVENNPSEWYTLMNTLVAPGILGSPTEFFNRYSYPGRFGGYEGARNLPELRDRSRPHYIRHTKAEVATHLPPLMVQNTVLDADDKLAAALRRAHRDAQEEIAQAQLDKRHIELLEGDRVDEIETGAAMTAVGMLRLLCSSPRLLHRSGADAAKAMVEAGLIPDEDGPKLDQLRELVAELAAAGERVVVFTSFRSMARLIAERFDDDRIRYVTFTGASSTKERDAAVLAFTTAGTTDDPGPTVFLATDAAAEGLNLGKCCSTLVNFDLTFKPSTMIQRANRIHRVDGDTTKRYVVINYTISRTIEEGILAMVGMKADLSDAILGESGTRRATTGRGGKNVFEQALAAWRDQA